MYTSSCMSPLRNALLMLIGWISHFKVITKVKIIRIMVGLTHVIMFHEIQSVLVDEIPWLQA